MNANWSAGKDGGGETLGDFHDDSYGEFDAMLMPDLPVSRTVVASMQRSEIEGREVHQSAITLHFIAATY